MNLGRFGPILVWSGCFGLISGVSHFSPVGLVNLAFFSLVGLFDPIFWGESLRPDLFILGKHVR